MANLCKTLVRVITRTPEKVRVFTVDMTIKGHEKSLENIFLVSIKITHIWKWSSISVRISIGLIYVVRINNNK